MMWILVWILVLTNVMAVLAYIGKDRPVELDEATDEHGLRKLKFAHGYWYWYCKCGTWAPAKSESGAFEGWNGHRKIWDKAKALEPMSQGDREELAKYRSTCICQNLV